MFGERKNEPRLAAMLTIGAARSKLLANGYEPTSLLAPDADLPLYLTSVCVREQRDFGGLRVLQRQYQWSPYGCV